MGAMSTDESDGRSGGQINHTTRYTPKSSTTGACALAFSFFRGIGDGNGCWLALHHGKWQVDQRKKRQGV